MKVFIYLPPSCPIDLHSIIKMLWKSMAAISGLVTSIFYLFIFLISYSVFGRKKRRKKLLQVWNNLRHHFRVSHCFKRDKRRQKKKEKKKACVFFYSAFASIKSFSIYLSESNIFTRFPRTPVQRVLSRRRVNFSPPHVLLF